MDQLPNLLVLSQTIPQSIYAGSIVLYRLLKDYPKEKLLVCGSLPSSNAEILECRYEVLESPFKRFERTRFSILIRSLRTFKIIPSFKNSTIESTLGGFKPDVILSVMQVQKYYFLAYRYAKYKNLPLILLVHDIPEVFERVYRWADKLQLARNAEVYQYAYKRLCISPEMRDKLSKKYGAEGDVLYPNRSDNLTPRPAHESIHLKQPGTLIIGYAGSLAYGYGIQLHRMIASFSEIGIKLRIYSDYVKGTHHPLSDLSDTVTYCGYAASPSETWSRVKQECDIVILPYCWINNKYQNLYKTHFPSKLPEYLALGMPLFIVGPDYATGVKWGLRNPEAAFVVTENNPAAWIRALTQLKESASLRQSLSQNAVSIGTRNFDPATIQNQFLHHLRQTLKNKESTHAE
ncbi:MAG: glycosyltransferase [Coleofasciculus sp. C1-SOL-03]|uniref:hypothetical protein n=1 Tax=Coleofasciculus sp. C1-SOL-03 TaxID=3069522 RepID=UPI0032FE9F21